jgi:O-succinylbenzoate synthase
MSRGLLAAACLPELRYACGLGTGGLFVEDVAEPAALDGGRLPVGPLTPDPARLAGLAAAPDRRDWWTARIKACHPLILN